MTMTSTTATTTATGEGTDPLACIFRRSGDDYIAEWPLYMVRMRFSQVYEEKATLHAEMVVYVDVPGAPVPAEWTQINLANGTTRAANANRLREQWDGTRGAVCPPYRDMLKEVSWWIAEQLRQGEPVLRLSQNQPVTPTKYRLYPILPEGQVASIYGDGGGGKSYLLLAMLLLLQEGREMLGLRPAGKSNVLYLDYECNWDEQQLRLSRVAQGLGITKYRDILYRECYRPLHRELPEIRRIIDDEGINVVAVDSMALAMGGDPKEGRDAIAMMGALRALRCSVLVLDHITKDGEQGKAYGSGFKYNYSRAAWELKKVQDEDSADLYIAALHRKANNGRKLAPLGFHLNFSPEELGPVTMQRMDIRDIPGLAENTSIAARIRHELVRGPLSYDECRERVSLMGEVKANSFSQTWNRLRKAGELVAVGPAWGLAVGR